MRKKFKTSAACDHVTMSLVGLNGNAYAGDHDTDNVDGKTILMND